MTADFSKILEHPDCDEIISKLTHGILPKDVGDWLKIKYSEKNQSHLRLSNKLLKDFLEGHLDLSKDIQQDILAAKTGQQMQKKVAASLKNNKTYQERIHEVADEVANKELDIYRFMGELVVIGKARIEQYFDKMQSNPENLKPDYGLMKWIDSFGALCERYDKMVNEKPDQIIQHNVTIQVVDQYVALIQDTVKETLAEFEPERAFQFMERLSERMAAVEIPPELRPISQDKRLAEAKIISETAAKLGDTEGEEQ